MNEPKKYPIRTLADIFNTVPADKIKICMAEIAEGMALASASCNLARRLQPELVGKSNAEIMPWPEMTKWVDDGKGECGFDCVNEAGAVIFGLRSKPSEDEQ